MPRKVADISDIDDTLALHYRYQVDGISEEDKKEGFVTTPFTREELVRLVEEEKGLFISRKDEEVVAYAMAASWEFWSAWPLFAFMMDSLSDLSFKGQRLTLHNSYQYGPVCLDKRVRGTGALQELFGFARDKMAERYSILVTFINRTNIRSFEAHTRKLNLEVIHEFEFNGNSYYELACLTTPGTAG